MRDSSPHDGPLVFGDFLEHLRRQGFSIGVGDYLRLQQLLSKISGDYAPEDLKTLLCPILATDKIQQEQFYAAFDSYFSIFHSVSETVDELEARSLPASREEAVSARARTWIRVLSLVLLATFVIALSWVTRKDGVIGNKNKNESSTVEDSAKDTIPNTGNVNTFAGTGIRADSE